MYLTIERRSLLVDTLRVFLDLTGAEWVTRAILISHANSNSDNVHFRNSSLPKLLPFPFCSISTSRQHISPLHENYITILTSTGSFLPWFPSIVALFLFFCVVANVVALRKRLDFDLYQISTTYIRHGLLFKPDFIWQFVANLYVRK